MLKIRGKLVLSFSLVMMILLSALGSITYFTLKDSISDSKENISQLSLKNHFFSFENMFDKLRYDTQAVAFELAQNKTLSKANLTVLLNSIIIENTYIDGIVAISQSTGKRYGLSGKEVAKLLNSGNLPKKIKDTQFLVLDKTVWASHVVALSDGDEFQLFYLLNMSAIWQRVLSSNVREPGSLFLVSSGSKAILTNVEPLLDKDGKVKMSNTQHLLADEQALEGIISNMVNVDDRLSKVGDNYVVSHSLDLMGWRLHEVIDEEDFNADLVRLKNRVIAATLVTLWFSIWIVLIVAHRISKPIRALSVATLEIQKLDYSNPLVFKKRSDEIGDLATSFETMRLHIEKLIFTDTLTGVFNRRYFMLSMSKELSRSLREDSPVALVMIDLDHFKSVNDIHGHGAGDAVLIAAAKAISATVREIDVPARYGGEEFCIVLPRTDVSTAIVVAERVREAVEDLVIEHESKVLQVTCSLGAADISHVENLENKTKEQIIDRLMACSDLALYAAKGGGRNRCVTYHRGMDDT